MRKVPKKKIFRSLCRTHKKNSGGFMWTKLLSDLMKLDYYKKEMEQYAKERENTWV